MNKTIMLLAFLALAISMQGQSITAQGSTCATTNACVTAQISQGQGGISFNITGSWSATLQFEASNDNGATWVSLTMYPSNSTTGATSTTSNGMFRANTSGLTNVRIRCSSFSSGPAVVTVATAQAILAGTGGGGGSGTVTSIATTSPITGGTITSTGTIACATCTTSAAALTSTALMTGAGSQATQTPSATSTLDSSGNASFAGTLSATGHTTFEGVTSTGATGTGKLVYDTAPTLSNPVVGTQTAADGSTKAASTKYVDNQSLPLYNAYRTGISMISGTGVNTGLTGAECTSGICTMTTPGADAVYVLYVNIFETAAGSGGTCTTGQTRVDMGYKGANGVTYATSTLSVPMFSKAAVTTLVSTATMTTGGVAAANDYFSGPIRFIAKSGTAITWEVEQAIAGNCTTQPVFSVQVQLLGPYPVGT